MAKDGTIEFENGCKIVFKNVENLSGCFGNSAIPVQKGFGIKLTSKHFKQFIIGKLSEHLSGEKSVKLAEEIVGFAEEFNLFQE